MLYYHLGLFHMRETCTVLLAMIALVGAVDAMSYLMRRRLNALSGVAACARSWIGYSPCATGLGSSEAAKQRGGCSGLSEFPDLMRPGLPTDCRIGARRSRHPVAPLRALVATVCRTPVADLSEVHIDA